MSSENYVTFWFRYQFNILKSKLIKKKVRSYYVLLLGRYPSTLVETIKPLLIPGGDFRYSLGANTIVFMLDTDKKIDEVDEMLRRGLSNLDHFLVLKKSSVANFHYIFNMNGNLFKNLYAPQFGKDNKQRLGELDTVIQMLVKRRNEFNLFIEEISSEMQEFKANPNAVKGEEDFEDDGSKIYNSGSDQTQPHELNRILQKIKETGYEQLTEEEKITLAKFSN